MKCKKSVYSCITNVSRMDTKINFHCDFITQFEVKKTSKSLQTDVPEISLKIHENTEVDFLEQIGLICTLFV
jgi:hypothetical protein